MQEKLNLNEKLRQAWNLIARNKKTPKKVKAISFSQFQKWLACPHLHYLVSIAKEIPYEETIYTVYGDSFHKTLEVMMLEDVLSDVQTDYLEFFKKSYLDGINHLLETDVEVDPDVVNEHLEAFTGHYESIIPALKKKFGNFKLIATEMPLYVDIDYETEDYIFTLRGYIDLLIQTEDGVFHIIDWKTTNRLWNKYKKNSREYNAQPILYKEALVKAGAVSIADEIKMHFILIPTKSNDLEFFEYQYTEEDEKEVKELVRSMLFNAFQAKQYIRKETCKYCDCKKYYDSIKNEEK